METHSLVSFQEPWNETSLKTRARPPTVMIVQQAIGRAPYRFAEERVVGTLDFECFSHLTTKECPYAASR